MGVDSDIGPLFYFLRLGEFMQFSEIKPGEYFGIKPHSSTSLRMKISSTHYIIFQTDPRREKETYTTLITKPYRYEVVFINRVDGNKILSQFHKPKVVME